MNRSPVFTRHMGVALGDDTVTVDQFTEELDVSGAFLAPANPRWVQVDGDTLTFTLANGTATYRRQEPQEDPTLYARDVTRYVRMSCSMYEAKR